MSESKARDLHRELLEQSVRETLAPLTLVLGFMFACLVALGATPLYNPFVDLNLVYVPSALLFFALGMWWRRHPPAPGYPVHLLGGVVSWLTLIVVLLLALDPQPREIPFQNLLVLAAGVILVSRQWYVANLLVIHASYVLAIWRSGSFEGWRSSVPMVTVTLATSLALHVGRHVYDQRVSQLTLESEARRQEAERSRREAERSMAALAREVEERNRLQTELVQAQKLESLGRLAGGIAHDFNNLLVPVVGNAEYLLALLDPDDEKRRPVEDIAAAGERAGLLTQQLLAYAGRGVMKAEPLDLGREIREIGKLVTSSLPKNTRLHLDIQGPQPAVKADRAQLHQVVANLILNAGEASAERGGAVTVRSGRRQLDSVQAGSLSPADPRPGGSYAFLQVVDQGAGMDEETLARMYDPFFSTKSTGRGLGLTAVLGIARRHGGGIRVESSPGQGTEFTVYLPATDNLPQASAASGQASDLPLQGRVLVVDDEDAVRRLARSHLERLGMEVTEAADGPDAVSRVQEDGEFDLVILDMRMPDMSGEETFYALRAVQPDLPILICSGYEREVAIGQLREERGVDFLAKPYRLDDLTRWVEGMLVRDAAVAGSGPDRQAS